jgi:hypothetical protein
VTHLDGRPRALDGQRLLIERLWRSLKHEDVYLKGYADGRELHNVAFQIGAPFTATAALTGVPMRSTSAVVTLPSDTRRRQAVSL